MHIHFIDLTSTFVALATCKYYQLEGSFVEAHCHLRAMLHCLARSLQLVSAS